jgi:uncharacterized protein (DUF1501 family)
MDPFSEYHYNLTRRQFFGRAATGIGAAALTAMLPKEAQAATHQALMRDRGALPQLHFAPKAKRIIYLFQSGGPSQMDLFDYKPKMREVHGQDLPGSVRMGQRLTGMTANQASFPVVSSMFNFQQHGESGAWVSELLPHTAKIADDLCIVKTVNTEAINHDPGITFLQTGHQQPGRPSMGAWMSYGLGSMNSDLPSFVVLISQGSAKRDAQALFQRLWGAGFLPSEHQGVNFRAGADPVLFLNDPPGIKQQTRRRMLDAMAELNHMAHDDFGDPEIMARISQYEMAYRMQTSVPDLMDVSDEPESTFDLYGPDARKPGTYAANCLLARRLAERDVRFIQLYHRGWDQHGDLPRDLRLQCQDVDQASAGLVTDLKQRGLLEDTLIVWGGEFGRTIYCQGGLTENNYGRDHHGRCYTMWMAGGGVKPGFTYGETDDFCYNIVKDPVHVHDLNATIMRIMGIDHERLTYRFQGRDFRITDVHGHVVHDLLA